jgi:hypothetical protein
VPNGNRLILRGMFEETIRKNLLAIVAAYRRATGQSMTSVSKRFYGRGDFLREFQAGRHTISVDRLGAMIRQFDEEWPEGADKPSTTPVFMMRRK